MFVGTHLHTRVERGTVRVQCLTEEHNLMAPARARTRTRSGVRRANHSATSPPTMVLMLNSVKICLSRIQMAKQQQRELAKCDATPRMPRQIKSGILKLIIRRG